MAQAGAPKKKEVSARPEASPRQAPAKVKRKRKFPYRKVEDLEAEIAVAETTLRELEERMAAPELYRDAEKVKQTTRAFEETRAQLQQLYEHWEEAVELN